MLLNANKCYSTIVHLYFKKLVNDIMYMQEMIYHRRTDVEKALVQFSLHLDGNISLHGDDLTIAIARTPYRSFFCTNNNFAASLCRTFYDPNADLYQLVYSKGAVESSYGDSSALGGGKPYMNTFDIEYVSTDESEMFTADVSMDTKSAMQYITNAMHTFFDKADFTNVYISNVNIFVDLCQYLRNVYTFDESYCKLYEV